MLDLLGDKLQFILGAEVDKLKDSAMNAFNDKDLATDWRFPSEAIQLSDKDRGHSILANAKDLFE